MNLPTCVPSNYMRLWIQSLFQDFKMVDLDENPQSIVILELEISSSFFPKPKATF